MTRFLEHEASWLEEQPSQYEIYPENLKEPYRTSRYELGEQMYDLLGIPRDNKSARVEQVMKILIFLEPLQVYFVSLISKWVHLNGQI